MLMALSLASVLFLAGQTSTHRLQPVQSSAATCSVNFRPLNSGTRESQLLNVGGRVLQFRRVINLRADGRVRADRHALQALDAGLLVPHRNFQREIALFVLRRGGRERAVVRERAHRQVVAVSRRRWCRARCAQTPARPGEIGGSSGPAPFNLWLAHRHLVQVRQRVVHGLASSSARLPRPFCRRFS